MIAAPRVAILGAGPVGLAAALEASARGWPFTVYEASGAVGASVRDWGHVRLFSPWSLNASARARRRLVEAERPLPDGDACPTGRELVEALLEPLAALPEMTARIRTGHRAVAVGREGLLKHEGLGGGRQGRPFHLLVEGPGGETLEEADLVLDCTGTWGQPNWAGAGGVPAAGERSAGDAIVRRIPDLDADGAAWAGGRTLLLGAGHSAQTAAAALATLAAERPGTTVVWAVRDPDPDWGAVEDDALPGRSALVARARALAGGASPHVRVLPGRSLVAVEASGSGGFVAALRGPEGEERVEVDRILALTGSVGDHDLYRQLQVHLCYATEGPMKLAAALLGDASGDCLGQGGHGPETLVNPEPGFFVLGSKSYGRHATFLLREGYRQVEGVFGLVDGGRERAAATGRAGPAAPGGSSDARPAEPVEATP